MIFLKKVNYQDADKEYNAITSIPECGNGLENLYFSISKEDFTNEVIPLLIDHSNGKGLNQGYVPDTYYFLWDETEIVGLVKIRHYLNEVLKNGAGHIGYNDFINTLSTSLKIEFPKVTGYSPRNLARMRKFYETYKDISILPTALVKLPWSFNCLLIGKLKEENKRTWYAEKCLENGCFRI